jgi:hypothetical protein
MAATFTTILSQAHTLDPLDSSHVDSKAHESDNELQETVSNCLKSSVESKSAKSRARLRWQMLRNLIHRLEFPKIVLTEERLASLKRNAPKIEPKPSNGAEISSEWLLQLQDFW